MLMYTNSIYISILVLIMIIETTGVTAGLVLSKAVWLLLLLVRTGITDLTQENRYDIIL